MDGTLAQNRFRTALVSLFSGAALTLAAIGLYGVMAYMVSQRTKEIGVCVAFGARPAQILSEILRSGGKLAVAGAIAGIVLAALVSRFVGALLRHRRLRHRGLSGGSQYSDRSGSAGLPDPRPARDRDRPGAGPARVAKCWMTLSL
jgi:ABC-type antimicrobial peptide transport system permease subunit